VSTNNNKPKKTKTNPITKLPKPPKPPKTKINKKRGEQLTQEPFIA
jgi:hypothetical protein